MRKEQIYQTSQPQSLENTLSLTNSRRGCGGSSKNEKKIQKKRSKVIRRTKKKISSETTLSSQTGHSAAKQNLTLCNSLQSEVLNPPSPISISIKGFICSPLSVFDQTNFQLYQIRQYLGNIGEHLFQRQSQFPLTKIQYSARFGPAQRLRLVELISLQCSRLKLKIQTQFLAFDIFHRICSSATFERYHSALKAASALYVAAKYEQLCAPQAHYFTNLDPNQRVLAQNIVKLQGMILLDLNFNLSYSTPLKFAQLLSVRFQLNNQAHYSLVRLCRKAACIQELCVDRGSLLAMACLNALFGRVKEWEEIDELRWQLDWRIATLQQLLGQ